MKFFGIPLHRPSYAQITSSVVLGVGLWVALLGLMLAAGQHLTRMDAGCALVVVVWSCLAVQLGIHVGRGPRHMLVNAAVCALLLGVVQASALAFGS